MADLIIQPKNDDHLKLNNDAGTTILHLANDESKLRLAQNNISASDGTTAITTSGANVTLAGTSNNIGTATGTFNGTFNGTIGTSASGFGLITHADVWRITSTVGGTSAFITGSGTFERVDSSANAYSPANIGTAMVHNSTTGAFGFPVTGKYLITAYATHYSVSGAQAYAGLYIYTTTTANSSATYTTSAIQLTSVSATSYYNSGSTAYFFDVTNISSHAVKFYRATSSSDIRMIGGTAQNESFVTFIRLGD